MAPTVFVLASDQEKSAIVKDIPLDGSSGILDTEFCQRPKPPSLFLCCLDIYPYYDIYPYLPRCLSLLPTFSVHKLAYLICTQIICSRSYLQYLRGRMHFLEYILITKRLHPDSILITNTCGHKCVVEQHAKFVYAFWTNYA